MFHDWRARNGSTLFHSDRSLTAGRGSVIRTVKPLRAAVLVGLACLVLAAGLRLIRAPAPPSAHEVLRQVYSPRFAPVPPPAPANEVLARLKNDLAGPSGSATLRRWLPSQSGTLWIALLILFVVGFDFARPLSSRNVDLVALQLLGFLFFDILSFANRVRDPYSLARVWWTFSAIVAVSLFIAVRAVWHVLRPIAIEWRPALRGKALPAVALLMLALNVLAAVLRPPDDAGYFTNLGAQRLRERALLPYGDPLLTGTPGAAYGPLLYVAHVPFQLLVDPVRLNPISSARPPLGADSTYYLPSPLATQLCTIAFQLVAVAALFMAGRRVAGRDAAWALVALYCGSAFVLGMGGEEYYIGGMTFTSHIAPPALTTAAFASLAYPATAGVLLVAAGGCGFYPAFLFPAWLGYFWTKRDERVRFVAGVVVAAFVVGTFVLLRSRPAGGRGLVGTILWDTFGHHSDPAGYGASPFGFWGQRGGWRAWMMRPLSGGSGLTAPALVLFYSFALSCFFLARRRGQHVLALLSAAVVIGANVVKIHSTGTYVAWFYPFLLLGLTQAAAVSGSSTRASTEESVKMADSAWQMKPDLPPS
jgi:hypothetical protein